MSGGKRPTGRNRTYGSGGGNAQRRGGGLGGKTGGPVGNTGGYSGRPGRRPGLGSGGASSSGGYGSGDFGSGGYGSGGFGSGGYGSGGFGSGGGLLNLFFGGGRGRSGCLRKIIMPGLLVLAVYVVMRFFQAPANNGTLSGNLPEAQQGGGMLSTQDSGWPGSSGSSGGFGFFGSDSSLSASVDTGAYPVDTSRSAEARAKRVRLAGDGSDTVTVMVYMCGTDLESKSGMATADLNEMLHAGLAENVRVIVETGGTSSWRNSVISSRTNQRYQVTNEGLVLLEDNLGRRSMVEPATLANFIDYCETSHPADRYILIFWDHGGGSLAGYGYDQHFAGGSMTLDEIGEALRTANCTFDWIGFDACLMGTLETAMVLEPYADYMIASEEVEPGIGWHYTGWLTALSKQPSLPTTDLGKVLIDDYIRETGQKTPQSQATLSLVDLGECKGLVPSSLQAFAGSMNRLMDDNQYQSVSDARAKTKEFSAASRLNQVDLIHFAENVGTPEARQLAADLRTCVKYNRSSDNITNAHGLSIFFPNGRTSQVGRMLGTYDAIGLDDAYGRCVQTFASVAVGGQAVSTGTGNPLDVLLGGIQDGLSVGAAGSGGHTTTGNGAGTELITSLLDSFLSGGDFSQYTGTQGMDWLDPNRLNQTAGYYAANRLDASALTLTRKNGRNVLSLPESQWSLVQQLELNVFLDDGEGFIDLGLDNVFAYTSDGDLLMEYDRTWLGINGQIVSYYLESDEQAGDMYSIRGRVPVLLNGELADLVVLFDNANPSGTVAGARMRYDASTETQTLAKGLTGIVAGDRIDYLCDFYRYDGTYSDTYMLGEQQKATGSWEITNLPVGNLPSHMTYRITDLYGNHFWTEPVTE